MKYGRTAWLTVQGLVLIGILSWALLFTKQRFVDGSHGLSPALFVVILGAVLGGTYGFSAKRILSEIKRIQPDEDRR